MVITDYLNMCHFCSDSFLCSSLTLTVIPNIAFALTPTPVVTPTLTPLSLSFYSHPFPYSPSYPSLIRIPPFSSPSLLLLFSFSSPLLNLLYFLFSPGSHALPLFLLLLLLLFMPSLSLLLLTLCKHRLPCPL